MHPHNACAAEMQIRLMARDSAAANCVECSMQTGRRRSVRQRWPRRGGAASQAAAMRAPPPAGRTRPALCLQAPPSCTPAPAVRGQGECETFIYKWRMRLATALLRCMHAAQRQQVWQGAHPQKVGICSNCLNREELRDICCCQPLHQTCICEKVRRLHWQPSRMPVAGADVTPARLGCARTLQYHLCI